MSFGKSKSKQDSQSQSNQTIDSGIMGQINSNIDQTKALAAQPYKPYTGALSAGENGYTSQAAGAAQGLLGFTAPDVAASTYDAQTGTGAQIDRSQIGNVKAGLLGDTDLSKYLNPYTTDVIDAANADNERARQQARMADKDELAAASAFGNSRAGVQAAETSRAYDENSSTTNANLRNQAFTNAQAAATGDLNRTFAADTGNQGVDLSVAGQNAGLAQDMTKTNLGFLNTAGQFNAGQTQAAATSNQDAAIRGAGVRTGAAGLLGDIGTAQQTAEQANLDREYKAYQDEQAYPLTMQQLLNQSLGLLPNPVLTNSSSKGSGNSSSFNFAMPSVSIPLPA